MSLFAGNASWKKIKVNFFYLCTSEHNLKSFKMKKSILILTVLFLAFQQSGCTQSNPQEKNQGKTQEPAKQMTQETQRDYSKGEVKILIKTSYGDITAKLYNDTPKHRDNMIKMIESGWYEDSPFHRIIKGFMIQGGGNKDGRQDPGYTVPAEILPNHFHKRGALAAARTADQVNPQRASSGCQFYIVQGTVLSDETLNSYEQRLKIKYNEEQRKVYTTVGGAPFLDGSYTVFGEVITGFDVIDKIAAVQTSAGDKPVTPVTMKIVILE
jgi:cyclophilin family peptidyl-prolyl cis-trans isomerase